jgi:hypothetical protein
LNLDARMTSGGSLINPSRIFSAATQANVLSDDASIQQAIDISSTALPVTVRVSAGQYNENLLINKAGLVLVIGADAFIGTDSVHPTISFDADGVVLDLTATTLANFHGTIANFGAGEAIKVAGATAVVLDSSGTFITVYDASHNSLGSINFSASHIGNEFLVSDAAITVAADTLNNAPTAVTFANATAAIAENTDTTLGVKIADIVVTDDALDVGLGHQFMPCHRDFVHQQIRVRSVLDDVAVVAGIAGEHRRAPGVVSQQAKARILQCGVQCDPELATGFHADSVRSGSGTCPAGP